MGTCGAQIPALSGPGRWGRCMSLFFWVGDAFRTLALTALSLCVRRWLGNVQRAEGVAQCKESVSATGYGRCRLGKTELRVPLSHVRFSRKWGNSAEDFLVCLRHSHAFAALSRNSVSFQFFLYLSVRQFASKTTFQQFCLTLTFFFSVFQTVHSSFEPD